VGIMRNIHIDQGEIVCLAVKLRQIRWDCGKQGDFNWAPEGASVRAQARREAQPSEKKLERLGHAPHVPCTAYSRQPERKGINGRCPDPNECEDRCGR
jgi:hypothetical protein